MKKLSLVLIVAMALSLTTCNSQATTPEKVVELFTSAMLNLNIQKAASYCTDNMANLISTANLNKMKRNGDKYESIAGRLHFLSDKKQKIVRSSTDSSETEVFVYFYDKNSNEQVGLWMFLLKQENNAWQISYFKLR